MKMKIILALIIGFGLLIYLNTNVRNMVAVAFKSVSISKADSTPQPLTKEEVNALIKENIQLFALSLNEKDMTGFYNNLSGFWQGKTSVTQLNTVFKSFIDSGIDLTVLKNMTPILDKAPTLTNKADLQVTGYYNTTPSVLHFNHTYYLQGTGEWKLAAFFIEVKKK